MNYVIASLPLVLKVNVSIKAGEKIGSWGGQGLAKVRW